MRPNIIYITMYSSNPRFRTYDVISLRGAT